MKFEIDYLRLQLEHARLKRAFLELQVQTVQAQHQLVTQEIERLESELSVKEANDNSTSSAADSKRN